MFCPKCGSEFTDETVGYCSKCRIELKHAKAENVVCSTTKITYVDLLRIVFIIVVIGIFLFWATSASAATPEGVAALFINNISKQKYKEAYEMIVDVEGFKIDTEQGIIKDKETIFTYFIEMNKEIESRKKPFEYDTDLSGKVNYTEEALVFVINANGKPMYKFFMQKINSKWRIITIERIIY